MSQQERPNLLQRSIRAAGRITRALFRRRTDERDHSRSENNQLDVVTADANFACIAIAQATETPKEKVHEDDICPICQQLIYDPVATACDHTLCRFCMTTWVSASQFQNRIVHVDVDTDPAVFDTVAAMQAGCPMCRTFTRALPSAARRTELQAKYPRTYVERQTEAVSEARPDGAENEESITLYIGNRHQELPVPTTGEPAENTHCWTFFVRPSRADIVEEVHFYLRPTFRDDHIVRPEPPYEITRRGSRPFVMMAAVVLRPDYSWVSEDAGHAPDGAPRGTMVLEWRLDFDGFGGRGSMGRYQFNVMNDRGSVDEEVRRDRAWMRVFWQFEQLGRFPTR